MPLTRCNLEQERQSFGWASTRTLRLHTKLQHLHSLQQFTTEGDSFPTKGAKCILGTDIFHLNNTQYLLLVDYYSWFLVIRKISNFTSKTIITQFKSIFAEFGIPKTVISDCGTQYISQEFQDFTRLWQIEHIKSSPRNPQSNGLAERFAHTVKNTLLKTAQTGEDLDLALVAYRTTPLSHSLPSLAELPNSRKFKTTLPTCVPSLTYLVQAKICQKCRNQNRLKQTATTKQKEIYPAYRLHKQSVCNFTPQRTDGHQQQS